LVALVQSIGSGHSVLGAAINGWGNRHLTRRINTRPVAAGRPFHCGCASITSAPLCAGVNGKSLGFFGWFCVSGLGAGLGSQARLIW